MDSTIASTNTNKVQPSSTSSNHQQQPPVKQASTDQNDSSSGGSSGHYHSHQATSTMQHQQASPSLKPTHRRGYSHGSYSLNNSASPSIINNVQHLPPATTIGSLGRHTQPPTSSTNLIPEGPSISMMKSSSNDNVDSATSNDTPNEETKKIIIQLEQKLKKVQKKMKEEQMKCNDNVNQYLKLSQNAQQPNQTTRIKTVFEKRNQKSSQKISKYKKEMLRLEQELNNLRNGGVYHRDTKEKLRDVGTNIKEGFTGLSGGVIEGIKSSIHTAGETVINKPKEFFKRSNVESNEKNSIEQDQQNHSFTSYLTGSICDDQQQQQQSHQQQNTSGTMMLINSNSHSHNSHSTKCTSDDDEQSSSLTSESGQLLNVYPITSSIGAGGNTSNHQTLQNMLMNSNNQHLHNQSPSKSRFLKRPNQNSESLELLRKIDERTQDCQRFSEEIDLIKSQINSEFLTFTQQLQDEKYRVDRNEEQLNDLTELHQKEIENLKQTITDLEEKIQYQMEERHRDINEMFESFQTRISRMEHQQHQQLQHLVNIDSLDYSNARSLVLKLINVVLTVLQVVLLLVATVANILAPFLQIRMRIFTSAFVIILFLIVFQYWPQLYMWTKERIYENCLFILEFIPFIERSSESLISTTKTTSAAASAVPIIESS